jgi:hypothetical protein
VALWQVLVRCKGDLWLQLKSARGTRAAEGEDSREGSSYLNDPWTPMCTTPVRADKNNTTTTDLGATSKGRVSDPLSVGDQEL